MPTGIAYVDETWNPVVGCTKCSPGCLNCYADVMARRFWRKWGLLAPPHHFGVKWFPERLDIPLHWHKPRRILVCSMGDLFHESVPFEFIDKALYVMYRSIRHTFLVLTKRPERMLEYFIDGESLRLRLLKLFPNYTPEARLCREWPLENVHLGVTICTQKEADEMIPVLLQIPATHRWLSIEPMLEEIDLTGVKPWYGTFEENLQDKGLHAIVVGCESGPKRRPCKLEHIRSIVQQCAAAGVGCFVKQISLPKVMPLKNIVSDIPSGIGPYVQKGKSYKAIVNQFGAVSAITERGLLGLKPDEFRAIGSYVEHDIQKFPKWARVKDPL